MVNLLTRNGIPPQLVGAFNAAQQKYIIEYAEGRSDEVYRGPSYPDALAPFADHTSGVVERFKEWGAKVDGGHISFLAHHLAKGETTYTNDFNLHADSMTATNKLRNDNRLLLRTLCVSSDPANFVGLTNRDDMENILDQYRISNTRVFNQDLLSQTGDMGGQIITPDCWETIVFDGSTPHLPQGVSIPNRRILMSGWIEMKLPDDWKARIQNNDAPQLVC